MAATVAALGVTAGLVLSTSSPAEAWAGDAGVTTTGFATCNVGDWAEDVSADAVWLDLEDTGEIEQTSVDPFTHYFEVRFSNVPASGSWAAVWVYCSPPGIEPGWHYVADDWVSRPWLTTTSLPVWVQVQD